MPHKVWRLAGLAALVAVALAGCGQGGGKLDLDGMTDDQVALNVEGMV